MSGMRSLNGGRKIGFHGRRTARGTGLQIAAGVLGMVFLGMVGAAPLARADTVDTLKAAIDAAHREAGCPPLQLDSRLTEVTDRAVHEVHGWVTHTGTFLPVEDSTVMSVLRKADYKTVKARMLSGYADDLTGGRGSYEDKAVKSAILQGLSFEVLGDCSYTKYGMSALSDDGSQGSPSTAPRSFTITSAILASG